MQWPAVTSLLLATRKPEQLAAEIWLENLSLAQIPLAWRVEPEISTSPFKIDLRFKETSF